MPETIGWGILSTGHIAGEFTHDLVDAGMRVAAVGSRDAESAGRFAERFGIPHAHGSYEELVADDTVDVVYVATPHPFHAANATLALEAGKHVLMEKPFALDAHEARAVLELAAEKGLTVLEALWTRYLPQSIRQKEILDSGMLGEVRSVVSDHSQLLPADPSHRINDPALGGGALLDLGVYDVSFASFVSGPPRTVRASARFGETGVDKSVAALFDYADGRIATFTATSDARGVNTAVVVGTKARLEIDAPFNAPVPFRVVGPDGEVLEEHVPETRGRGRRPQAEETERCIREGLTESPVLGHAEIVSVMETLDEIRGQIGLVYPQE